MKLSENTLNTFKNFTNFNKSLLVIPGNVQRTANEDVTVIVEAKLEDSFPSQFGIFELTTLLSNISTLNKPDITLNDNHLVLDDGQAKIKYFYCSPKLIKSPDQDVELKLDDPDAQFDLPQTTLQKALKLAALNGHTTLTFYGKNGRLGIQTKEPSSDSSNTVDIDLGEYAGKDFSAPFAIELLSIVPDDYKVAVRSGAFAVFTNKNDTLKYFIALISN